MTCGRENDIEIMRVFPLSWSCGTLELKRNYRRKMDWSITHGLARDLEKTYWNSQVPIDMADSFTYVAKSVVNCFYGWSL